MNKEPLESKTVAFAPDENPGKIEVTALIGYEVENVTIDGLAANGTSVTFNHNANLIEKNLIIDVT